MDISTAIVEAFRLLLSGDAELWGIVRISVLVSLVALLLVTLPALVVAYLLATRLFYGRRLVLVVLQGFLSFPTVVVGLILYLLLSRRGPLGAWDLLFTPQAMILGQMLIAFPVLTVFALSALQKNTLVVRETAVGLGAGFWYTMWTAWHEVRFGIMAALLAGFGRVVSEVGCALIVGGNIANQTRTIPTAITLKTGIGAFAEGIALGIVLIFLALVASALLSILQGGEDS